MTKRERLWIAMIGAVVFAVLAMILIPGDRGKAIAVFVLVAGYVLRMIFRNWFYDD